MKIGVLHLIDSLERGGAEQVAVSLVNHLPRDHYRLHLCVTRQQGPLSEAVAADVAQLCLWRRYRFEPAPLRKLNRYIRDNDIRIVHAHSTSLFSAVAATLFGGIRPGIIWHDHYGYFEKKPRPVFFYRLLLKRVRAVIAVSEGLARWSSQAAGVRASAVWYIPNYVSTVAGAAAATLPGTAGQRTVCLANFRPQKDHRTLLEAFSRVVSQEPGARLFLIGKEVDTVYSGRIRDFIRHLGLETAVYWLGEQRDVAKVLAACDIGVLSSSSEGFPLALLEYAGANLAVAATDVGQCAEILGRGEAGVLVPPASPSLLAEAILALLREPRLRLSLAQSLQRRVNERFGRAAVIAHICQVYETVLNADTSERCSGATVIPGGQRSVYEP